MRTSIVVKCWGDHEKYERAATPEDQTEPKLIPRYVPAHTATGWNGSQKEWKEPEAVYSRSNGFHPKKGIVSPIRVMPGAYVDQLENLDREREKLEAMLVQLRKDEQQILKNAFPVSQAVTVEVVKVWTEAKKAK